MKNLSEVLASLPEKELAELRKNYRFELAQVLKAARKFKGSELQYETLLQRLISFEGWLLKNFPSETSGRFPIEDELTIQETFHNSNKDRSIAGIMDLSLESFDNWVRRINATNSAKEAFKKLNVFHVELDGTILPPGENLITRGDGDGEWDEKKIMPRLEELILFLNVHEIYTDDFIICSGILRTGQVRKTTYYLIEIPKLNKQILCCNQVGEATFVIHGMLSREILLKNSKEILQNRFGDKVQKIVYKNPISWQRLLEEAVFKDNKNQTTSQKTKIDVQQFEHFKNEISSRYTPESWLQMNYLQRRELFVNGKGYTAIARVFGIISDNVFQNYCHLELARIIFGEDCKEISLIIEKSRRDKNKHLELNNDAEKWREAIKKVYTYEQWIALEADEKENFDLFGKSLRALGDIFGMGKINIDKVRKNFLVLTLRIYGDQLDMETRGTLEKEIGKLDFRDKTKGELGEDQDKWRAKVIATIQPSEWVSRKYDDFGKIKIEGFGIAKIAKIFNVRAPNSGSKKDFLVLGKLIYGEEPIINAALEEIAILEDLPRLRSLLREKYSVKMWIQMTVKEKRDFRFFGMGLRSIGGIFGVKGDAVSYQEIHLRIGAQIFDETEVKEFINPQLEIFEKQKELGEDLEKWRYEIKQSFTREQFLALKHNRKREIFIQGRGLPYFERIFGVDGSVLSSKKALYDLASKIFDN